MKFSTSTVTFFSTLVALGTTTSGAFTVDTTTNRAPAFGLSTAARTNNNNFATLPSSHSSSFSVTKSNPRFFSRLYAATTSTEEEAEIVAPGTDPEVQRLRAMAAKLRQEAATLEAQQAEERAKAAERAFEKFDLNNDGELSLDELKAALEKTFKMENLPQERVQRLMEDFDKSGDGKLQKDEFLGVEQFRNRLESLAQDERKKALEASKEAQKEEEQFKFVQAQLELINDKPPSNTDKIVSVLPYLFPLMDGLMFGRFLLSGTDNPVVTALAVLYTIYRSIPLGGFIAFFALNILSGNLSINRLVRFNMQQAIFLDVALFIPGLIAALTSAASAGLGFEIPPGVGELGSDAIFFTLIAAIAYSTVSSLLGVTPDKLPFISNAVNNRLPSIDMFDAEGRFDPKKSFDNTNKENEKDQNKEDDK